jgi:hypothetical protein
MTRVQRTGRILTFIGLGMVVFSLFMMLDLSDPLVVDASVLTDEAMEVIATIRRHFGQYTAKMYIANVTSMLGGLIMTGAGIQLSRSQDPAGVAKPIKADH